MTFTLFGPLHWAILLGALVLGLGLGRLARDNGRRVLPIRYGLGVALLAGELFWYPWLHFGANNHFPYGMPFQLCGYSAFAGSIAALTLNQRLFEFSYYAGLAGAYMALVTPDLWAPLVSYPSIYFFISHILIVAIPLFLAASRTLRLTQGSWLRAFYATLGLAVFTGIFDWATGANYMYLRAKPAAGSLMDLFGPWPVYLLVNGALALGIYFLLYLPWREGKNAGSQR